MKKLLYGKEIIKSFGTGEEKHRVLNRVSVEIESGESVSIMGPSGSGKSTLLYVLGGMDDSDSGEVAFDGQNLSGLSMMRFSICAGAGWPCFLTAHPVKKTPNFR